MPLSQNDLFELYGEKCPTWRSRGYVPHFEGKGLTQSITFRLADSLPAELMREYAFEFHAHEPNEVERRSRVEAYLDLGKGSVWLQNPQIAAMVQCNLLWFDNKHYQLHAWVVMPNHVHVLITPKLSLPRIVHSWKSFTSNKANELLGKKGAFWQREYFDRFIRDERFNAAVTYIENNPVKAGLCDTAEKWRFSSARWRSEQEQM